MLAGASTTSLDEYRHAAQWYEDKREGWGDVFMDAVDAAVDSILDPAIGWGFYQSRKPPRSSGNWISRFIRSLMPTSHDADRGADRRRQTQAPTLRRARVSLG